MASPWEAWLDRCLKALSEATLLRSLRPLFPQMEACATDSAKAFGSIISDLQTFDGLGPWDRSAVEFEISRPTFQRWFNELPSSGDEICNSDLALEYASGLSAELGHKMILFSGNDYLGLSTHPSVRQAASKAAIEFGMGPRGSALVCGYTYLHRSLESALADLKKTEDCLLCPTGFAANMAVMTAITTVVSHAAEADDQDVVAIFSDALNHASIIDGIRLSRRQRKTEFEVYKHCDVDHLNQLLSNCKHDRKVVVTDSLFSMDGDFAALVELVALRKKYNFLLVIDDAHGTLLCGETGGGVAEALNVEGQVDIVVGTLSKAIGCQGGFIACSRKWKQLIQSRGRSFVFSTALPVPVVAAAHAAILVAQEEKWRQRAVWDRVSQLAKATGLHFSSPIAPIIFYTEERALAASRSLMLAGFHVTAIRPPTVPKHSSRLRITLTAAHTVDDVEALAAALVPWIQHRNAPVTRPLPRTLSNDTRPVASVGYKGAPQVEKTLGERDESLAFKDWLTEDIRAKL
ncbi:hypothetical protein GOP47_0023607 [Adiantum capillus-veneris]|uniref:Aminotransferase class I/classII large domain-containing protein n=1 Tax=Adiantum capillus-veneris TaxID=13818 RepID=A0A9D4Z5A5_ADICA|nr:hypothetical protein GOP47_0023607 [Adiantum capillus-veneris]